MRYRAGLLIFFAVLAPLVFGILAPRGIAFRRAQTPGAVVRDDPRYRARVVAFARRLVPDKGSYAARCLAAGIAGVSSLTDPERPIDSARIDQADRMERYFRESVEHICGTASD